MYRWKPNATQRREFAEKMKDPEEKQAYEERKYAKTHYNPNDSRSFANRSFVPTESQYIAAINILNSSKNLDSKVTEAANMVISGYSTNEKVHHDYIHIINHFNDKH